MSDEPMDIEVTLTVIEGRAKEPYHFTLDIVPPRVFVHDLQTREGTFVNDVRIAAAGCELRPGDRLRAGATVLHIQVEEVAAVTDGMMVTDSSAAQEATTNSVRETTRLPVRCVACGDLADERVHSKRLVRAVFLCAPCLEAARRAPRLAPGYRFIRELGRGVWEASSSPSRKPPANRER
jgi:FHA domain